MVVYLEKEGVQKYGVQGQGNYMGINGFAGVGGSHADRDKKILESC